ncbi:MAG: T9SS type A sorting domain-containing protein, partial [Pedobacter sp.]
LGMCLFAHAQDESYRGGNADGHAKMDIGMAFGPSNSFQVYFGGNADGHAADSLVTFNQNMPATLYAPYRGSSGDGHAADSVITFAQYASITMFAPFLGSFGDGYATDSIIAFNQHNYISMYQPYGGGDADGWTSYPIFGVVILPINLLSFTGEQVDKKHILRWETAQEQHAAFFEVQRSKDARHFETIGKVDAAGNSNVLQKYFLNDLVPMQGNNFYRLKKVDQDGSFEYSNVILLKVNSNQGTITVYPNPTTSSLNVLLGGLNDNSIVTASISDMSGKIVRQVKLRKNAATINFNVEQLPAGVYNLRILWNNELTSWRFIKQ